MKKAFTLIELLTVMMIMGLLGTAAVGGYRAMQRGMEERGVLQNANAMIRAAYQRAQIDRQPTVVFFWNETVRSRTSDENEIVVGRAVAVRRYGRISNRLGKYLVDEFSDLNLGYPKMDSEEGASQSEGDQMYLYPMDKLSDLTSSASLRRSTIYGKVVEKSQSEIFLSGTKSGGNQDAGSSQDEDATKISAWAFELKDENGISWKPGMAYGFEFISVQLPDNYIFGSSYSASTSTPVVPAGALVFKPGLNSGNGLNQDGVLGASTITIYSLRPDGANLKTKQVGTTESPEENLR